MDALMSAVRSRVRSANQPRGLGEKRSKKRKRNASSLIAELKRWVGRVALTPTSTNGR